MKIRRRMGYIGWMIVLAGVAACSNPPADVRTAPDAARPAADPVLTDIDSRQLAARIASFRGHKAVLVNFWEGAPEWAEIESAVREVTGDRKE